MASKRENGQRDGSSCAQEAKCLSLLHCPSQLDNTIGARRCFRWPPSNPIGGNSMPREWTQRMNPNALHRCKSQRSCLNRSQVLVAYCGIRPCKRKVFRRLLISRCRQKFSEGDHFKIGKNFSNFTFSC